MQNYFGKKSVFIFCLVAVFFSVFPHSADGIKCFRCNPGKREKCTNKVTCPSSYNKCAYAWNSKTGETANGCSDEADKTCGVKGHFSIGEGFVGDHGCVCKVDYCNAGQNSNDNLYDSDGNEIGNKKKDKGSKATFQKANALIFVICLIPRIFNF